MFKHRYRLGRRLTRFTSTYGLTVRTATHFAAATVCITCTTRLTEPSLAEVTGCTRHTRTSRDAVTGISASRTWVGVGIGVRGGFGVEANGRRSAWIIRASNESEKNQSSKFQHAPKCWKVGKCCAGKFQIIDIVFLSSNKTHLSDGIRQQAVLCHATDRTIHPL